MRKINQKISQATNRKLEQAQVAVSIDELKGRLKQTEDEAAKQEVRIQELGGRLERAERVILGMMGQGVYKSDMEVMKKWMGNRWIIPVSKRFGLEKPAKKKPKR